MNITNSHAFSEKESCRVSHRVGSFTEALQRVKQRVSLYAFPKGDMPQAIELCLIIAEVEILPDGIEMQIGGDKLPVEMVREVYNMLQYEHLEMVIDHFKQERRALKYKKSYLRTAIYNSMFELESNYINEVRQGE